MDDLTTAELRAIDYALSQQITLARKQLRQLRDQGRDTDARHLSDMIELMHYARAKIRVIPFPPDPTEAD